MSQDTAIQEEGIKYDANKPRLGEMFLDFNIPLEKVAKVWEFGVKKYGKGNWKFVVNARNRYTNALLRHLAKEADSEWDEETHLLHAAHVAWNALARLYFIFNSTNEKAYLKSLERRGIEEEIVPASLPLEDNKDILDSLVIDDNIPTETIEQLTLDLDYGKSIE